MGIASKYRHRTHTAGVVLSTPAVCLSDDLADGYQLKITDSHRMSDWINPDGCGSALKYAVIAAPSVVVAVTR